MNLGLNIVGSSRRLHFKGDGFVGDGLCEDLHATMQTKEVEGCLLLDVVVKQCALILKLIYSEDKMLLIGGILLDNTLVDYPMIEIICTDLVIETHQSIFKMLTGVLSVTERQEKVIEMKDESKRDEMQDKRQGVGDKRKNKR